MTEAQMEYLEKAFPKGFVITYVQPNGNVQVMKNNPNECQGLNVIADITNSLVDSLTENYYTSSEDSDDKGEEWKKNG